ncbi:MAG: AbrB/MazE/SpoVT family DNA-binding domain-containing protein [Okeania sp. SIO3C4]|nr:AbrB/MazE/SpoVT family DNA-binding domain-containing protein [Okeania sp. SIO3C4]
MLQTLPLSIEGNYQVLKIPLVMKIDDSKVFVKVVGNSLQLIPFHDPWKSLFDSLEKFSDDFMNDREQPEHQEREGFE